MFCLYKSVCLSFFMEAAVQELVMYRMAECRDEWTAHSDKRVVLYLKYLFYLYKCETSTNTL